MMRRLAWNVMAFLGLVAVVAVAISGFLKIFSGGDDAPVRVRNGSLDIFAAKKPSKTWKWTKKDRDDQEATESYSNEPQQIDIDSDINLRVIVDAPATGGMVCEDNMTRFVGERVVVIYTDGNTTFKARIRRGRQFLGSYRTRVRPVSDFQVDAAGQLLRHGQPSTTAFISEVRAGDGRCTFKSAADLNEIRICSSSSTAPDCK